MEENNNNGIRRCGQYDAAIKEIRTQMVVKKVSKVLMRMEKEKVINKFGSTMSFSDDDLYGTDFIIYPLNGKKILIQVKTRYLPGQMEKYEKKDIYCLTVPYKKEESEVRTDILKILEVEKQKVEIFKSTSDPLMRKILIRSLP